MVKQKVWHLTLLGPSTWYLDLTLFVPGYLELRYAPGGGPFRPPPTISARCGSIFKKSDSMVSYGGKELTCKISSKSGEKHGSYGSSKKIGTRDSSRIGDKEQKTQNGPNRKFFFFSKL